jgi:AraC family transcriptional regulator, regulatory protein of adaptative response / DNA-3-methyladenine glycosylase II
MLGLEFTPEVCQRAVDARDARFDGLFYVGITTTRVYCRPVCPARVSYPDRRRFFGTAAAAEHAGFRPCLRCRPELAPGAARCDAVSRLAQLAAHRISAGALNGHTVADLATDLGVSERHLRRAFERELGVSPIELAQTHRLLLAKRLLADTSLSVTRVAYASGFQSLRRFNSVFRAQYRMPPSALRRAPHRPAALPPGDLLHLTLGYRPPMAWTDLLHSLESSALPGVAMVAGTEYRRILELGGVSGVVTAEDAAASGARNGQPLAQLRIGVSPSLVPVLMPVLARLRHLFDLDAVPAVVEAQLEAGGLGDLTRRRPGLRLPGAVDGFEAALEILLPRRRSSALKGGEVRRRVVEELGQPLATPWPELDRRAPAAARMAEAGTARLEQLGVPADRAGMIARVARLVAERRLLLEHGHDVATTHRTLVESAGVPDRLATEIVMRALGWPDGFTPADRTLQHAAGVSGSASLLALAERWRPWRAYAALLLRQDGPALRSHPGHSRPAA